MKLVVLFVVFIITIFPAESQDFPENPVDGDFAVDQDELSSSQLAAIDSMEERKWEKEMKLRGKSDKKNLKALMKKLVSLDKKLSQANSEMKKSLDSYKNGNIKLSKDITDLKVENQAIKKNMDSYKDGNSKQAQDISDMKKQLQAIKKRQGYLTFHTERVSWDVADARCKSFGARLAVLTNPQGFHAFALNKYKGQTGFWLGATDKAFKGNWVWSNGEPLGKFPWGPNEPSGNEGCLEWYHNNNYNDESCRSTRGYVCEHGFN